MPRRESQCFIWFRDSPKPIPSWNVMKSCFIHVEMMVFQSPERHLSKKFVDATSETQNAGTIFEVSKQLLAYKLPESYQVCSFASLNVIFEVLSTHYLFELFWLWAFNAQMLWSSFTHNIDGYHSWRLAHNSGSCYLFLLVWINCVSSQKLTPASNPTWHLPLCRKWPALIMDVERIASEALLKGFLMDACLASWN